MATLVEEAEVKIRTLWVDYSSEGDSLMPNVVLAVDEYLDDENPKYWNEHFERERRAAEEAGYRWRVIVLEVSERAITGAFGLPHVQAEVVDG